MRLISGSWCMGFESPPQTVQTEKHSVNTREQNIATNANNLRGDPITASRISKAEHCDYYYNLPAVGTKIESALEIK
jgi:hypothetical protein